MDWIDASPLMVKDLEDAMDFVWNSMPAKTQQEFMQLPADKLWQCHHGLGTAIRNSLGLWETERFPVVEYFKSTLGLFHADDISHIITCALHSRVTGFKYDMAADVREFKAHWKRVEEEEEGR